MARANTECTELSVGFGLINIEPTTMLSIKELTTKFEGTLSSAKYQKFLNEFAKQETYYRRFWRIGVHLRNTYTPFANLTSIRWEGAIQQANRVSMAIDLMAANTAISVKANSNVVSNLSLHTVFVSLPIGGANLSKSENWYYKVAPSEYQTLYLYARNRWASHFPEDVAEYLTKIKGKEQKQFLGKIMAALPDGDVAEFNRLYLDMCHKVAKYSATMFNEAIKQSFSSGIRTSVIQQIARQVFRIGDTPYILCGLDKNHEFAVKIPDLTSWTREWQIKNCTPVPILMRGRVLSYFH